jgi:predicted nucleic acid-binding protein
MEINVVLIDERSALNLAETLLIRPLVILGLLRKAKSSGRIYLNLINKDDMILT